MSSGNSAVATLSLLCQVMKNHESRSFRVSKEAREEASLAKLIDLKQRLAAALTAIDENNFTQIHTRSKAACRFSFGRSLHTHSNGPIIAWEAAAAAQRSATMMDSLHKGNGSKSAGESQHMDKTQMISFQNQDMTRLMGPPCRFRGEHSGHRTVAAAQTRTQTLAKSLYEVRGMYASPMPEELPSTKLARERKLARCQ